MFDPVKNNQHLPDVEKEVLNHWLEHKIFEQSVEMRKGEKKYVFFDGPPFANGLPHYGHILASALKDAVTRYWNMKGYYVPRTNGWDCHGLPVEYEIEKTLEISGKKEIEELGVDKFNNACRESVFRYTQEWQGLLERIGRWVDFENTYATLDTPYMESIWWVFKQIWDKDLMYQEYRSMHVCPRCETPLSNFEVSLGYKEVTDLSVTSKFKLNHPDHPDTYVLAWTTTPWTLPANMALCFGPEIEYSKIKQGDEHYILASALVEKVFAEQEYELVDKVDPKELEHTSYEPLFPYYADEEDKKRFVCVLDDYVSTEDGTGVVHIAGGFGAEDFAIAKRYDLDIIVHIGIDGHFLPEVKDFEGKFVKGQEQNLTKWLDENNKLFSKENYRHSYPHCWRCDTPLLNYSLKSWYIAVTQIKERLLKNNQQINWQPPHIKDGRFGKWLENVRDWNISRNRYWGTPLPIWECDSCEEQTCLGSIKDLRIRSKNGNTIYFVRHGQSDHNVKGVSNSDPHDQSNLTDKGKEQAQTLASKLKEYPVTKVYSSPFQRAEQTATIIAKELELNVEFDERIREVGQPHNRPFKEVHDEVVNSGNVLKFKSTPENESYGEVAKRLQDFLNYLSSKYQNEHIVIVTHGALLGCAQNYFEDGEYNADWVHGLSEIAHDAILNYYAGAVPMREDQVDLHKPYIDDIELECDKCAQGTMRRIPEVLDCWFESGAMPYAKPHYPFEDKKEFEENFPAQFIAEGLDQTRGWFYTLHVLSTILFDKPAFQNIIVNGILLAKNGEKLSKRKKNYPDPNVLFDTKGVDATRLFLYQSTTPLAEDVRFSDDHVDEVFKKFNLTLWNTYSFFLTYANIDNWKPGTADFDNFQPKNELDQWILSELQAVISSTTKHMDEYNLTKASRPLSEFVDQLSNWYVRRSRRRFWKSDNDTDKNEAYTTLYLVLTTFTKVIAPFTPFIAEAIYRNLTGEASVHFCDWPKVKAEYLQPNLNTKTNLVRKVVSLGHTIRAQEKLKVRQPLSEVEVAITDTALAKELENQADVILEELNIKKLTVDSNVSGKVKVTAKPDAKLLGPKYGKDVQEIIKLTRTGDFQQEGDRLIVGSWTLEADEFELGYEAADGLSAGSADGMVVILHTELDDNLIAEGYARDLVRTIQDMRKEADYQVSDRIQLLITTEDTLLDQAITQFADYIEAETLAIELQTKGDLEYDLEKELTIDGSQLKVAIKKADV